MGLRRIPGNAATAFILLALVGCSGSSADGRETGDGTHADSVEGFDAAPPDTGDAATDGSSADAEPPPVAPPHCGDGVLDPDEECDDGNRLDGDDCDWLCRLGPGEPVDDTPDPNVGDLERDLSWISVESLPADVRMHSLRLGLVWTGSAYATVWNVSSVDPDGVRREDARFRLFDRLGHPIVPDWTYHYPDRGFSSLDLAWSGRFFGLVWCTGGGEDLDCVLSAMILDAVGKPLVGPFTLLEDLGGCGATVTWGGEAFAAVWRWEHGGGSGIGTARFDELGSILSVAPSVYEAPPGTYIETPSSASSPAATVTAFIEWPSEHTGSDGRRLRWLVTGGEGRPLRPPADLGPIDVGPAAIAWGERHFAIVFGAGTSPYDTRGFRLALLDADGFLLGPPRPVLDHANYGPVALAWGAGGWAIAYEEWDHEIHLLRTDAAGRLISAEPTADAGTPLSGPVAMAFDGEGFGILTNRSPDVLFTRYVVVP